jgi:two-component system sensor histidine kinase PilS (NtrC family)
VEATRKETLEPAPETLRGLILFRIVIVSTLILSALLIQLTFSIELPLRPIYYLSAFAYGHSLTALLSFRRIGAEAHAALQIMGDLFVVTGLVYLSHGPDSGFTFLYLGVVAAGAILLGWRGGLVTAGLAAVFYAVLVDLTHFGILPVPDAGDIPPRVWSTAGLVGNVALNVSAFVATALLVAKVSDKLRETRQDLLRRKEEIARLQALHASVLSSMSSGVVTADLEGTIILANRAAEELLEETPGSLDGAHVLALGLIDAPTWERVRRSDYDIQRSEASLVRAGAEQFFGTTVSPLRGSDGAVNGHILIFQNLTTLKRLEGEVRLKEKLAAVGELAAAIAHEIRNPLASISGSVQVLSGSAAPGTSDFRLMEIVVRESHRLSAILEDFLRYTRPRERAVEQVNAVAALRDVMTLLSHSDELTTAHRLETSIEPDAVSVLADPGQLRQVFWNLARNAVAAMPKGGTFRVTARLDGDRWTASFADEGRGMSAQERERLFTPFAHSFPGGTGLGLAIVYRIVEEHSGSIRVDTELGKGTTIVVALPVSREAAVLRERDAA